MQQTKSLKDMNMKLIAKKSLCEGECTVKVSIKWLIFLVCIIVNFRNGVMSHHELPCKAIAACLAPIYGKTSQVLSQGGGRACQTVSE